MVSANTKTDKENERNVDKIMLAVVFFVSIPKELSALIKIRIILIPKIKIASLQFLEKKCVDQSLSSDASGTGTRWMVVLYLGNIQMRVL